MTRAHRDLQDIARKGGNGADGHLWQQHKAIAENLFSEGVYMHPDEREFIPRDDFDEVVKWLRAAQTELFFARRLPPTIE